MASALALVEETETDRRIREERVLEAARLIIGRLDAMVRDQVRARQPIEERWISNIQQYLGIYPAQKLSALESADQSTAFVKLTRRMTNSWSARISDLLFPTDNKNWGVTPTPIPSLTGKAREAQAAAIAKVEEANRAADAGDPAPEQIIAEAGELVRKWGAVLQAGAGARSAFSGRS